jgi:DnaJ-class molecular chaperone
MRIKHAYNTLLNSSSRKKYDSGNRGYNSSQRSQSRNPQAEEEFYGLGTNLYSFAVLFGDLSTNFNFVYIFNFVIAYETVKDYVFNSSYASCPVIHQVSNVFLKKRYILSYINIILLLQVIF